MVDKPLSIWLESKEIFYCLLFLFPSPQTFFKFLIKMVEIENIGGRRKVIFDPGGDPGISVSAEDDLFYFLMRESLSSAIRLNFSIKSFPVPIKVNFSFRLLDLAVL